MRKKAIRAILNPLFGITAIAAAIFHLIEWAKAKEAIKLFFIHPLVARKILALTVFKKRKTVFHKILIHLIKIKFPALLPKFPKKRWRCRRQLPNAGLLHNHRFWAIRPKTRPRCYRRNQRYF